MGYTQRCDSLAKSSPPPKIAKELDGDYKFGCKPSALPAEDSRDKTTATITF